MMKKIDLTFSQLLLFGLLILPISLLVFYEYLFAADRFESHASVYITEEQTKTSPLDLSMLGITTGIGSTRDILVLKAFIESQGMMLKLDRDLALLSHFSSSDADFFSRLGKGAAREIAFEHYLKRIVATFDDEAQLLEISVQTYDRDYSKKVLEHILKYSQAFIDQLNENIKKSQLRFFESAVKSSEDDLIVVRQKLTDFQRENRIFSTELTSQTIAGTLGGLESSLAQKQAELNSRLGILNKNAPTVLRIQAEINALQNQIKQENERLASGDASSLAELDSTFRELQLQIEYKALRYKSNLQAYEQAYVDTARRLRFLTVVAQPTLAEASLYPNRPYVILTGTLIALVAYFVVAISIAMIREHS